MSYAPFPLVWGFFGSGGGGGGGPAFGVIQTDFGTYPTASGSSDVLTLISADSTRYYFTGTALTDTITLTVNGLIPPGGNYGQILAKASGTNFDIEWRDGVQVTSVYNNSGSTIAKGSVVYINGASGNLPTIALSQANAESTSSKTYGLVVADISNMSSGAVVASGQIRNLDTFGVTEGVTLWLSPSVAGGYTTTKPTAPNHAVAVGVCTRAHPTLGTIEVKIQNGYELEELHNVSITSPSNGQVLSYDSSTSLWKNTAISGTGSVTSVSVVSANGLAGTVANSTTTPAITLSTTVTGILKGNGTSISAASAGTDYQAPITGAATTITSSDLTANRVLLSDASGKVAVSSVSNTTLGYLDATSSIQTQINNKVSKSGDTMTGPLIVSGSVSTGSAMVRITNTGLGDCFVVEDSANPDSTPFKIDGAGFIYVGSLLATSGVAGKAQFLDSTNASFECKAGSTNSLQIGASTSGNIVSSYQGSLIISTDEFSDYISIFPGSQYASTPAIYAKSDGTDQFVGIGNTSPSQALHVTGNILASGTISGSNLSGTNTGDETTASIKTKLGAVSGSTDGYVTSTQFNNLIKADGSVSFIADQSMNSHKLTNVTDPSNAQDAATKAYVDNLIAGLDWKQAVHAASIANINLASAPASVDSHTLISGERVLVKDQSTQSENGIYQFNGAGSAMTRTTDADSWSELVGAVVYVEQGSTNQGTKWNNTNISGGTLGVTAVTFTVFSAAGSLTGSGTTGYNAYWTSSNNLAGEQYVSTGRGGLGTTAAAFTGLLKFSSGVASASTLVNTDVSATAAIDYSKLAALTANRVLISNASGVVSASSITDTTLSYLDATSSIQTQLNTKVSKSGDTMTGPLIVSGSVSTGSAMVRITNTGTGDCLVVEDSANPDLSPFKIDSSGVVIVGSPLSTLGGMSRMILNDSGTCQLDLYSSVNTCSISTSSVESRFVANTGPLGIYTVDTAQAVQLYPSAGDALGPAVYCKTDGSNIYTGINKTTPSEALDVNGNIKASGTILGSNLSGTNTGNVTIGTANGLSIASQVLSLSLASSSSSGSLSSSDWTNFNTKLSGFEMEYSGRVTMGSATINGVNGMTINTTGTHALNVFNGANTIGKIPHITINAISTTGSTCGFRTGTSYFAVGGGLILSTVFQVTDVATVPNARHFFGANTLTSATSINGTTNNNPLVNSLTNFFAFASDAGAGDTNFCIYHNGATAGATTRISLGASFPNTNTGEIYQVSFYNPPASLDIYYRVTALVANVTTSGKITGTTSNLPTTSLLYMHNERFNAGTGSVVKFESGSMFIYSFG